VGEAQPLATLGLGYLKQLATPAASTVWQYGYGGYDEEKQRVTGFAPLAHFTGQSYQGGPNMPDPQLQYLLLTAEGGHPGDRTGDGAGDLGGKSRNGWFEVASAARGDGHCDGKYSKGGQRGWSTHRTLQYQVDVR